MQVSWIDPEEVARLAAQLDGPLQREETAAWDISTLPDFSGTLAAFDEPPAATPENVGDAMHAGAPETVEQQGAPPPAEIASIREKLRALRSRAEGAGMLPVEIPATEPTPTVDQPRSAIRIPPPPAVQHEQEPPPPTFLADTSSKPLADRLKNYMDWAQTLAPCEDLLLVDDHGDLLWGGPSRADLALSVVLAAGAGLRSGAEALTRSSVFIRSRFGEQKELSILPCQTRYGTVTLALLNAHNLGNNTAARLRQTLQWCIDGTQS